MEGGDGTVEEGEIVMGEGAVDRMRDRMDKAWEIETKEEDPSGGSKTDPKRS
jgi:hypothetical protein